MGGRYVSSVFLTSLSCNVRVIHPMNRGQVCSLLFTFRAKVQGKLRFLQCKFPSIPMTLVPVDSGGGSVCADTRFCGTGLLVMGARARLLDLVKLRVSSRIMLLGQCSWKACMNRPVTSHAFHVLIEVVPPKECRDYAGILLWLQ